MDKVGLEAAAPGSLACSSRSARPPSLSNLQVCFLPRNWAPWSVLTAALDPKLSYPNLTLKKYKLNIFYVENS